MIEEKNELHFDSMGLVEIRASKVCYSRPARCPRERENAHCERQWEHSDAEEKVT